VPSSQSRTFWQFPYELPRNAFSARDAARAGDIWRAFQDIAVGSSSRAGWPPRRLREIGSSFVVRSQYVVHHQETAFGEQLRGESWVINFRRETLSARGVRLLHGEEPVASGVQEWVHINLEGRACRAPSPLVQGLAVHPDGPELPSLPEFETFEDGESFETSIQVQFVQMDPLDHVNHPAYIDFVDESLARWLYEKGIAPLEIAPVAESATFYVPIKAPSIARIKTTLIGFTPRGDAVFDHEVGTDEEPRCTKLRTFRRLATENERLQSLRR